jgi:hypothetical protein
MFLSVSLPFLRMTNLWPLCISPTKLRENKKRPKHPQKSGVLDVDVQTERIRCPGITHVRRESVAVRRLNISVCRPNSYGASIINLQSGRVNDEGGIAM